MYKCACGGAAQELVWAGEIGWLSQVLLGLQWLTLIDQHPDLFLKVLLYFHSYAHSVQRAALTSSLSERAGCAPGLAHFRAMQQLRGGGRLLGEVPGGP